MPKSLHRIRKLHYLVTSNNQIEAFSIRKILRDHWQDNILTMLEDVFDRIDRTEQIIHIPKLEIHCQITSEQDLLTVLPELIKQQLHEQLLPLAEQSSTDSPSAIVWQTTAVSEIKFANLLKYLQTGVLPWSIADLTAAQVRQELTDICHQQQSPLLSYLSQQPATAAVYFRLQQLLPDQEFTVLMKTFIQRFPPIWQTVLNKLLEFVNNSSLSQLSSHVQGEVRAKIMAVSWNQLHQINQPDFHEILDDILLSANIDRDIFISTLPHPTTKLLTSRTQPHQNANDQGSNIIDTLIIPPPILDPSLFQREENQINSDSQWNQDVELPFANQFSLPVNYAGLILIHPFINTLLESTSIKAASSKEIAPPQLAHAAALLHYLATGHQEIYEYELGFIKILLGLTPNTPLPVGTGLLQESDRAEAEALLAAALNYWTVLKNTSVAGLRSSFLQRSGLLRQTDQGWSLQIEPQSFDMLLEHLPWSISIVKLSWMTFPIYTEWQTF
jgi:hypothetical protein